MAIEINGVTSKSVIGYKHTPSSHDKVEAVKNIAKTIADYNVQYRDVEEILTIVTCCLNVHSENKSRYEK